MDESGVGAAVGTFVVLTLVGIVVMINVVFYRNFVAPVKAKNEHLHMVVEEQSRIIAEKQGWLGYLGIDTDSITREEFVGGFRASSQKRILRAMAEKIRDLENRVEMADRNSSRIRFKGPRIDLGGEMVQR